MDSTGTSVSHKLAASRETHQAEWLSREPDLFVRGVFASMKFFGDEEPNRTKNENERKVAPDLSLKASHDSSCVDLASVNISETDRSTNGSIKSALPAIHKDDAIIHSALWLAESELIKVSTLRRLVSILTQVQNLFQIKESMLKLRQRATEFWIRG